MGGMGDGASLHMKDLDMGAIGWKGRSGIVALVLAALVAPRFITAAPLDMLDGQQAHDDPAEEAAANFPGSAFFFAEGAFDPVPGAQTVQSEHVMGLDEVKAAPAATKDFAWYELWSLCQRVHAPP